jgi:hypothetical protein
MLHRPRRRNAEDLIEDIRGNTLFGSLDFCDRMFDCFDTFEERAALLSVTLGSGLGAMIASQRCDIYKKEWLTFCSRIGDGICHAVNVRNGNLVVSHEPGAMILEGDMPEKGVKIYMTSIAVGDGNHQPIRNLWLRLQGETPDMSTHINPYVNVIEPIVYHVANQIERGNLGAQGINAGNFVTFLKKNKPENFSTFMAYSMNNLFRAKQASFVAYEHRDGQPLLTIQIEPIQYNPSVKDPGALDRNMKLMRDYIDRRRPDINSDEDFKLFMKNWERGVMVRCIVDVKSGDVKRIGSVLHNPRAPLAMILYFKATIPKQNAIVVSTLHVFNGDRTDFVVLHNDRQVNEVGKLIFRLVQDIDKNDNYLKFNKVERQIGSAEAAEDFLMETVFKTKIEFGVHTFVHHCGNEKKQCGAIKFFVGRFDY